ncbi:MAG: hypothetical protein D6674_05435 [Acidobacteria bacterium]|jgi:uncharacterized metal-binding protein|nr:MAG: hypothetical protein D6674_05435 [Acidobacteriota bacterium]
MALGRRHDLFNLLALPPCLYLLPKEVYLPFTAGYLIGTFFLSPDLDLRHSKPSRRWKVFRYIWRPYQAFSRHRGISHVPLLGVFIKLLYLFIFLLFLYFFLLGLSSTHMPEFTEGLLNFDPFKLLSYLSQREWAFYLILGIFTSEVFHIVLDILSSSLKKLLK